MIIWVWRGLPRKQSSWGQDGAHLGPVGPRWTPSLAPLNLAIGVSYNKLKRKHNKTMRICCVIHCIPHWSRIHETLWWENCELRYLLIYLIQPVASLQGWLNKTSNLYTQCFQPRVSQLHISIHLGAFVSTRLVYLYEHMLMPLSTALFDISVCMEYSFPTLVHWSNFIHRIC